MKTRLKSNRKRSPHSFVGDQFDANKTVSEVPAPPGPGWLGRVCVPAQPVGGGLVGFYIPPLHFLLPLIPPKQLYEQSSSFANVSPAQSRNRFESCLTHFPT